MLHLRLTDRDIERVLAGHQPNGRQDLAEVAQFVAQLRAMGDAELIPPMSPRLLAELDAAEIERRDDRVAATRRREVQRARRRWRLVGAAAVVTMLGGLLAAGLRDASRGEQTEMRDGQDGQDADKSNSSGTSAPASTKATAAPTTTTTTAAPSSSAPAETAPSGQIPQEYPAPQSADPGDGSGQSFPGSECVDNYQDLECWLEVWREQNEGGGYPGDGPGDGPHGGG